VSSQNRRKVFHFKEDVGNTEIQEQVRAWAV